MKNQNILCTICARAGSKGVVNKNIKIVKGLPLIAHTINHAINSKIFTNILVSSNSNKIINISKKIGAEVIFKRPDKLSTDNTPKIPVILHLLKKAEKYYNRKYDIIIDLDPTSPLRKTEDIIKALKIFEKNNSNNLFSVTKSRKNPYFNMIEIKNNRIQLVKNNNKFIVNRRQDSPAVYDMNASIYIWKRNYLLKKAKLINKKTSIYIMPENRSIDIDTIFDFKLTKYVIENEKLFK